MKSSSILSYNVATLSFAIVVALVSVSTVNGNLVVNGGFENTSGTFPNGWAVTGGVASQESGSPISGVSLRVSGSNGNVAQTIGTVASDFIFRFDWKRPFSTFPSGQRSMNTHLRSGVTTPFINMRVQHLTSTTAAFQIFDGSWMDLDPSGAATQLILDPLTTYSFTIAGSDFGTANANYDLTVVGGTMNESFTDVGLFQNNPISTGELVDTIRFERSGVHGSATYDNISFVAIPEASQILCVALVGAVAAIRR